MLPFRAALFGRAAAAGGGSAPSSAQWRILFPTGNSRNAQNTNLIQIREVEMRASIGGADLCSGGAASASTTFGGSDPENAFDNSIGSSWSAAAAAYTDWLQYTFASPVTVEEVEITHWDSSRCPSSIEVQYHDGVEWVTYFDSNPADGPIPATDYTTPITVANDDSYVAPTGYTKWRLYINSLQSSSVADIKEFEMMLAGGAADQCFGVVAAASAIFSGSYPAVNACDNNTSSRWASGSGMPQWWSAEFQRARLIEKVTVEAQSTSQAPKNVDVQYYDDDLASWVTDWSFVGAATTSKQTFTKP